MRRFLPIVTLALVVGGHTAWPQAQEVHAQTEQTQPVPSPADSPVSLADQAPANKTPAAEPPAGTVPIAPAVAAAAQSEDLDGAWLEFEDPAFEPFIDLAFLQEAVVSSDPALLTDAALLLRRGEAALYRRHKAFSSAAVFTLAIRSAVRRQDKAALDRLHTALTALGEKGLIEAVAAAKTLAGASRAVDPLGALTEKHSEETKAAVQLYVSQIAAANLVGIKADLEGMAAAVKGDQNLDAPLQEILGKSIAEALEDAPAELSAEDQAIAQLTGESRSAAGTYTIKYTIKNLTSSTRTFSLHGSGKTYTLAKGASGSYVATQKIGVIPYVLLTQPPAPYVHQIQKINLYPPARPTSKHPLSNGAFYIRPMAKGYSFGK